MTVVFVLAAIGGLTVLAALAVGIAVLLGAESEVEPPRPD